MGPLDICLGVQQLLKVLVMANLGRKKLIYRLIALNNTTTWVCSKSMNTGSFENHCIEM